MKMRATAVCLTLMMVTASVSVPSNSLAQDEVRTQNETLGHGEGTPAADDLRSSVIDFVEYVVERMSSQDGSIVNVADETGLLLFNTSTYNEAVNRVTDGAFANMQLIEADDVREHDDGLVSIEVVYLGYYTYYDFVTVERWYLIPGESDTFILHNGAFRPPRTPEGMTGVEAVVTLTDEGLTVSENEFGAADVIILTIENSEPESHLTTGIYPLPDGMTAVQLQVQLKADDADDGMIRSTKSVGVTPVRAGSTWTYGFLVQPGTTYIIQEWVIDSTGNVIPLEGEQYVETFSIAAR